MVSDTAETALRRLAARAAHHMADTVTTVPLVASGRHLPAGGLGPSVNALVDLVAIAEIYFADRLADAAPGLAVQPTTWKNRADAWRDAAGYDLRAHPRWPAFMGFVEARNALQHGLGRLTDMQLNPAKPKNGGPSRRDQVLVQIKASGLHLNGNRLTVLTSDVARCAGLCPELIRAADAAVSA